MAKAKRDLKKKNSEKTASDVESLGGSLAGSPSVTDLAQAAAEFAGVLNGPGGFPPGFEDEEQTDIIDAPAGHSSQMTEDILDDEEGTIVDIEDAEDVFEDLLSEDDLAIDDDSAIEQDLASDELAAYSPSEAESELHLEAHQVLSVLESLLFASDKPVSFDLIRQAFKGTNIKSQDLKRAIEEYRVELSHGQRGVMLEEVGGGFQIRTKTENVEFLRRSVKNRVFKLSGPALEVLAIVAYQQPIIKSQIDEIRGVDSGHLLRALMDRGLVKFAGKSEFPGRPMLYESSRKFLEIFGLRNIRELPSPSEIDDLIPEGIGEPEVPQRNLGALTDSFSLDAGTNYSQGEDELLKISAELSSIDTSTEFFEQEKARQKNERDNQRAQDIRENILLGQAVEAKELRWLERFEKEKQAAVVAQTLEAPGPVNEITPVLTENFIEDETSAPVTDSEVGSESEPNETIAVEDDLVVFEEMGEAELVNDPEAEA